MEGNDEIVQDGHYVIIQRQNYMKIHKITKKGMVALGKDEIDIGPIVGEPFWTTYKLESKVNSKRAFQLQKCKCAVSLSDEIIKDVTSGVDNREIIDDGSSQKLSTEEIVNLRACGMSAQDIVSQLVENSKTFMNKTEYSQEKYLKKKEKKYFEYITIIKPTFRLVAEILTRQPNRVLGMRMDTIAQLTTLACVRSGGTYLLYESGCEGLAAAALLNHIGIHGNIIHLHSVMNTPSLHAVLSLNFSKEQLDHLISVNIQRFLNASRGPINVEECPAQTDSGTSEGGDMETTDLGKRKLENELHPAVSAKRKKYEEDMERALNVLKEKKADALLIVAKEHPCNIFQKLVKFLNISRPFVIYCAVREPLQELYCELKARSDVIAVRLTESWLRSYQVLPDRTHPDINISGSGGFLLSGILVSG